MPSFISLVNVSRVWFIWAWCFSFRKSDVYRTNGSRASDYQRLQLIIDHWSGQRTKKKKKRIISMIITTIKIIYFHNLGSPTHASYVGKLTFWLRPFGINFADSLCYLKSLWCLMQASADSSAWKTVIEHLLSKWLRGEIYKRGMAGGSQIPSMMTILEIVLSRTYLGHLTRYSKRRSTSFKNISLGFLNFPKHWWNTLAASGRIWLFLWRAWGVESRQWVAREVKLKIRSEESKVFPIAENHLIL